MKKGVLVMAYGSPNKPEDIEPYYTDIRRGNKPTPELLAELTERYEALGGGSPLLKITNQQAERIQQALGSEYKTYIGMRHWNPWISEAVAEMKNDGITEAVGVVMAPHFSSMSIAKYIEKVEAAKQEHGADIKMQYIESWHNHPLLIEAFLEKIEAAKKKFSEEEKQELVVIFTAHSLPERIMQQNDPYKSQLLETCELTAKKGNIKKWEFAFQSAGRTQEKWLGPDLLEVIERLTDEGVKAILICSVGFITDHLEVMYDIDIEAKQKAAETGVHLERAASLNDDARIGTLIGELVKKKLANG